MKKSTEADLAMSKAGVKISGDLLGNPLCEQDQAFLESMNALDTAMKRMDAFNQEKASADLALSTKSDQPIITAVKYPQIPFKPHSISDLLNYDPGGPFSSRV
ncbi:hypothetical protein PO909_017847 [Leuciscus waleckii]